MPQNQSTAICGTIPVMVIAILVIVGLCLGSFVNALVWRLRKLEELESAGGEPTAKKSAKGKQLTKRDLSITRGRSMCVHCHHELAAKDLIPVLSYLMLRGKCRYCRKPIPDTPLAELLTPALFVVSYLWWPDPLTGGGLVAFVFWLFFLVGFVALAIYDIRWFELPHRIVLPLIALALLQVFMVAVIFGGGWPVVRDALLGAAIGGGLFWILYAVSPKEKLEDGTEISKWIGGGDITLGTLLGLLVGGPGGALLVIFVASLLGTLVAVPLIVTGRAGRGSHLPFGPYLLLAAFIVRLWGESLIDWYTSLLLG